MRFKQITAGADGLYGLDDNNAVWFSRSSSAPTAERTWERMPDGAAESELRQFINMLRSAQAPFTLQRDLARDQTHILLQHEVPTSLPLSPMTFTFNWQGRLIGVN